MTNDLMLAVYLILKLEVDFFSFPQCLWELLDVCSTVRLSARPLRACSSLKTVWVLYVNSCSSCHLDLKHRNTQARFWSCPFCFSLLKADVSRTVFRDGCFFKRNKGSSISISFLPLLFVCIRSLPPHNSQWKLSCSHAELTANISGDQ